MLRGKSFSHIYWKCFLFLIDLSAEQYNIPGWVLANQDGATNAQFESLPEIILADKLWKSLVISYPISRRTQLYSQMVMHCVDCKYQATL